MMTAKKERKTITTKGVLVDRISGQPRMTIEFFLIQMLKYKILTQPEVMRAYNTGLLPSDILERILKLVEKEREN